ncbi:LamB/YcsF family protein [Rhodococcus sp. KBS0724]|uniref:LamB/YcsF family protein n=1 Tax=Rhodococcus sp. KBS0724 TaxID=1179674 RepID=UPI00110ECA67|nr:5-oxoprolinase subunit PxpA [Rhodococcus sp. KBS0724]TSD49872.1 LamB/YcsF family protein [Rhodococcus sp. KBS0724]
MTMVDLVADVGESFGAYRLGDDVALLDVLTSANVACGFHAGDPRVMDSTVAQCAERGIAVGAHPSFPDLVGFGRRTMDLTRDEICSDVLYQVGALHAFAVSHGTRISHVTPHGRLGNLVVTDDRYAHGVLDAVLRYDRDLLIVTQEGRLAELAREAEVRVVLLGLADRAYNADGTLVSRQNPGAVITDPDLVVDRVVRMVRDGSVVAIDGSEIAAPCDSVLLHGDTPGSVELAQRIRRGLDAAGVTVAPMSQVLDARQLLSVGNSADRT